MSKIDLSKLSNKAGTTANVPDLEAGLSVRNDMERGPKGIALDKRQFEIKEGDQFVVLSAGNNEKYVDQGKGEPKTTMSLLPLEDIEYAQKNEETIDTYPTIKLEIDGEYVDSKYDQGSIIELPEESLWHIVFNYKKRGTNWAPNGVKIVTLVKDLSV